MEVNVKQELGFPVLKKRAKCFEEVGCVDGSIGQ
jgi:hypothetical protein